MFLQAVLAKVNPLCAAGLFAFARVEVEADGTPIRRRCVAPFVVLARMIAVLAKQWVRCGRPWTMRRRILRPACLLLLGGIAATVP